MDHGGFKERLRRLLPKTIRPHRILSGRLRGFRIVTSWHDYPAAILGRTEHALLNWFDHNVRPGETWLDIGAHYGYTAIALSRLVGRHGRVFAFEPMVATAGHLAWTRSLNGFPQLTIVPLGLAAPDTLELGRLPVVRGMVGDTGDIYGRCVEPFLVARLDWVWPILSNEEQRVDGVKIDVQGMEIETIVGMRMLLRKFHPKLVVELHHGVSRLRFLDAVESVGYSRVGVPIEPGPGEVQPEYLDDRSYRFEVPSTVSPNSRDPV